ncbi:tetratricopeptide repeat-containing sensor histidine kinase [Flavobacterium subsaxonicum]|uniref:histidine kinase n=1 Tax=Flavobacterium subsaxonicum WB 4.1-42 = DSM 21790 TaxID=1121898 RepID=A0A0A2MR05_9FLAO|nr:tetratricopeptide repeat-containing sensor histidine kinase [Flavobacterium subsaxonicum]KGO93918.1 hypothetical protein Q766_05915 [Flavobacterium subsaxonicum WB 4.1-42 = DSM 21790]
MYTLACYKNILLYIVLAALALSCKKEEPPMPTYAKWPSTKADTIIDGYSEKCNALFEKNQIDSAFKLLEKAVPEAKGDKRNLGRIALKKSEGYLYLLKYPKALEYGFESLDLMKQSKDSMAISRAFHQLYFVWYTANDLDLANSYLDSTLVYSTGIPQLHAYALFSKGDLFSTQKKYLKSSKICNQVIKTLDSFSAKKIVLDPTNTLTTGSLAIIASNYIKLDKPELALQYLDKIKPYYPTEEAGVNDMFNKTMADYYVYKKQYTKAQEYLERILKNISFANKYYGIDANTLMATCYSKLGNYKKACYYQALAMAYRDSIYEDNSFEEKRRKEANFYLIEKNNQIARNKIKIKDQEKSIRNRNWLAAILVTATLFLILTFYFMRKFLKEKLDNEKNTKKLQLVEAGINGEEKERERIAKELHDAVVSELLVIRLNLQSMEGVFANTGHACNYQKIIDQSGHIAEKLRATAYNLIPVHLNENGLYSSIDNFIKSIVDPHFKIRAQFYGELPPVKKLAEKVIFFIVLELIQNIIKHSGVNTFVIQLLYADGVLGITAEDDGVGFDYDKDRVTTMGLSNIAGQVAVLNASMDIQTQPGQGCTVYIEIPMETFLLS